MARKATVDREVVLQMLKEGKTSQVIANRFAVSRQAIDLYRKQFTIEGILTVSPRPRVAPPVPGAPAAGKPTPPDPVLQDSPPPAAKLAEPTIETEPDAVSLDKLEDLIIQAFTALKRNHELEAEMAALKKNYEAALHQIEQLKEREMKRREQEQRWLHAQQPGIMTYGNEGT